jgi:hypothetical protein
MDARRWFLLLNLAVGFYGVGLIWLVQMSCYPLWAYVGHAEFHEYHIFWWHSIWGVCFVPAGLSVLGIIAMIWWRPPGVPAKAVWLGIALQFAIWFLTAIWWAPLMARLGDLSGPAFSALFHKLLVTHWLRVALITAYGILLFWMTVESFRSGMRDTMEAPDHSQSVGTPLPAGSSLSRS